MLNHAQSGCHQQIVTIDDVFFSYENKTVIQNLSYSILERDFVGLIGANGAGKTTLLKMIVGLLKPTSGEIRLFGQSLKEFRDWERIGYVPQKNALNPLFPATVREVVTSGLFGKKNMFRRLTKQQRSKCDDALYAMRIEDLADRRIGQLSGGQQQRVFLARALVNNPELLILDEPTVGIDAETQAGFFRMIRHMHQHHHITFLMVSHDMDMMESYLGSEPAEKSGGLSFYVKHTHEPENCRETDLTHSMQQLREKMEVLT
ncbi:MULTISPECIES: metal ABC transporter ATP-binding protein [unclassified Paenibacillus]|uniref:metal ABC transporter ATP-binding protein n=1 Tax=unclassified Paenibacillus TaxID=185978 RepID=UPI001AE3927D|nr:MULTISPECIES: metal ABC transporter ATP-binding protein [unclassified Paenibacillus]MBP1155055.1 zinc transport system ATP-binding protein [Paenibacillus sp. PvP091]MBP1169562.1 zinc transport system ATP-binding protein [Paenibacillus sp. PvR098]MBP2440590.1 zinc transport system ATP-binding protein [Paenibacillus sp. PvP052]